ncbi:hypothetical protein BT67DRAFT_272637 [Trichocladium antarcticum]|uniref:Uncharacterized protein n=1 Tax=Trichocladium antarcticum TaxID=1450529 RepID=A0AAN6ZEG4_9PEZI|nr:hypothetical protein BT67DRAFT_272637 [Trichocladium antarcticum]
MTAAISEFHVPQVSCGSILLSSGRVFRGSPPQEPDHGTGNVCCQLQEIPYSTDASGAVPFPPRQNAVKNVIIRLPHNSSPFTRCRDRKGYRTCKTRPPNPQPSRTGDIASHVASQTEPKPKHAKQKQKQKQEQTAAVVCLAQSGKRKKKKSAQVCSPDSTRPSSRPAAPIHRAENALLGRDQVIQRDISLLHPFMPAWRREKQCKKQEENVCDASPRTSPIHPAERPGDEAQRYVSLVKK